MPQKSNLKRLVAVDRDRNPFYPAFLGIDMMAAPDAGELPAVFFESA
jgi:hypothetical protein